MIRTEMNVGITYTYTYNDEGLRTSKTVNGVTTEYYWDGTRLILEKSENEIIHYLYDSQGRPFGMQYCDLTAQTLTWETYWFTRSLQGDVTAVYNTSGTKLVSYTYNAWGEFSTTYYNGGRNTNAVKNSLLYRGYYYDTNLGLYYLQSRYYDARTCRFINADSLMSGANGSLHGFNLFVYCFNNPVNMTDGQGDWPRWVENAWGCVVDAYEWTSEKIQTTAETFVEVISDIDFTYSFGPTVGMSLGIIGANYSPVWSIDDDGNVALQHTVSWGITTNPGFGAVFGSTRMVTNAPNVNNLLGEAGVIGASLYVLAENMPVGGSLGINFIPDKKNGETYLGLALFQGFANSPGGDIYGGYSETYNGEISFNIFTLIKNIFCD